MKPLANCTTSNVPGPQQSLYFNGAKVQRMMGVGRVIDGVGLNLTALSYDGDIVLTISGCADITPTLTSWQTACDRLMYNLGKQCGP